MCCNQVWSQISAFAHAILTNRKCELKETFSCSHVLYHKPTITFRIYSVRKYHHALIQQDAFNRHPLWLMLACVASRGLNSPLINLPCDRRSRYQLYGLDWRGCALQPGRVVLAMLLLFFWWFNGPDTLKGSSSGLCLCNSTTELEASSLTREAECVLRSVYADHCCTDVCFISYVLQIVPKYIWHFCSVTETISIKHTPSSFTLAT